jgi:hypothetical protein
VEQQAFKAEYGWMKEADHWLLGHQKQPVFWERFVAESAANGEMNFKVIEQRKPPKDQSRPPEDTTMGAAVVVWSQFQVAALRHIGWASDPMKVSGLLLSKMFRKGGGVLKHGLLGQTNGMAPGEELNEIQTLLQALISVSRFNVSHITHL